MAEKFDVIVLGAGWVGLTAAGLLAEKGFSVAVVEQQAPLVEWLPSAEAFDIRCIAVSKKSEMILQGIGVWDRVLAQRVSPYRKMVVWDALGFGEISFDAADVAEPALGHIVENAVMLKALQETIHQNTNVTLFTSTKPVAIEFIDHAVRIRLTNEIILEAQLVVGADGKYSWVREALGIETTRKDYEQSALIANVTTEAPHQETAWQRFLKTGPLAFLPLNEPYTSSIVWTSTPGSIEALMALSADQFCKELAHQFDYRLGKVLTVSVRNRFALEMLHAKRYVAERTALIGDALHVVHPLAGQGVNLGLYDADALAHVLCAAREKKQDIGHPLVLRRFERSRKASVTAAIAIMDFLKSIFGSDAGCVIGIRSLGVNWLNRTPSVKKKLILHAMGLS